MTKSFDPGIQGDALNKHLLRQALFLPKRAEPICALLGLHPGHVLSNNSLVNRTLGAHVAPRTPALQREPHRQQYHGQRRDHALLERRAALVRAGGEQHQRRARHGAGPREHQRRPRRPRPGTRARASARSPPHVPRSESTTRTAYSLPLSGRRFGLGCTVGSP